MCKSAVTSLDACTPTSTAACEICFNEAVYGVPGYLRDALDLDPDGDWVDVPRTAVVRPDNGTLAHPPAIIYSPGHGGEAWSESAGHAALSTQWPEAVVIYLEASRLVDHDGQWRAASSPQLGDPDWSPRFPHFEAASDHTDLAYLEQVLDEAQSLFSYDEQRLYATGHSSGGFFTLSLMEFMPERFRAFAMLGAYADYGRDGYGDTPVVVARGKSPQARPVLSIMGLCDATFPWSPGASTCGSPFPAPADRVHETVRQLTARAGAFVPGQDDRAYLDQLVAGAQSGGMGSTSFAPAKTHGRAVDIRVYPGGHSWPAVADFWVVDYFRSHDQALSSGPDPIFERGWAVPALMSAVMP